MTTTLLAVDDSATMRKVLEITFAGEDYRTVLASSGQEAVVLAGREKPAVALVDHAIGTESGYSVCQDIKAATPGIRVVLLSSKQHPFDKSKAASAGVDDFMDKPFDTQKLLDKVQAVLSQAPARPAASPAAPPVQPVAAAPARPAPASMQSPARPRPQTLAYGTASGGTPSASPRPAPTTSGRTLTGQPVTAPPAKSPPVKPSPAAVPARPVAQAAAAATSGNGELKGKLSGLGLSEDQIQAVLALSREVVEQVVWEVVPVLAETMIKEELRRLTSE